VEKYGTARQARNDNIIRRMRFACWITKATDTHPEYVILIAFPRQEWLRERSTIPDFFCILTTMPSSGHIFVWTADSHSTRLQFECPQCAEMDMTSEFIQSFMSKEGLSFIRQLNKSPFSFTNNVNIVLIFRTVLNFRKGSLMCAVLARGRCRRYPEIACK
jgi:hypothetical protein